MMLEISKHFREAAIITSGANWALPGGVNTFFHQSEGGVRTFFHAVEGGSDIIFAVIIKKILLRRLMIFHLMSHILQQVLR